MQQIVAAIRTREFYEDRRNRSLISWSTRMIAIMVAGGYMTDGKDNPALDMAFKLAIDEIETAQLDDAEKLQTKKKITEPALGSYERFASAFGGNLVAPTSSES